MNIEGRNAQLHVRLIHSLKVIVDPEHDHSLVVCLVGFSSFEALDGVVKGGVGRVKHERLVRNNLRSLPTSIIKVIVYL